MKRGIMEGSKEGETSVSEAIEMFKAIDELVSLFKAAEPGLNELVALMDRQCDGSDKAALFRVLSLIADEGEDNLTAMLFIAVTRLSRIRLVAKGTPLGQEIEKILELN